MIRTNAKGEVILPFFRVGVEEMDLAAMLNAVKKNGKR